jgi:hypothetical protein
MLTELSRRFLLSCAITANACSFVSGAQGLISLPLPEFRETGPTTQVIKKLARAAYGKGLIGFESLEDPERGIFVAISGADFGTALRTICVQDPRYKLVETDSPDLVNLLPAGDRSRGHKILEFRIPKLDIEADDLPENLIVKLAVYSPELWKYLLQVYLSEGGLDPHQPGAGGGFSGNAKLPHYSIHLTNTSVKDLLNEIALESLRIKRANPRKKTGPSTPDELYVSVTGWEFRFVDPRSMSFYPWIFKIFRPLQ